MDIKRLTIDGLEYLVVPKDYTIKARINNSMHFESNTGLPVNKIEEKLNSNLGNLLNHYVELFMPQIVPADLYFDYTEIQTFVGQLNRYEIRNATATEKQEFHNKEVITLYYDYNAIITI